MLQGWNPSQDNRGIAHLLTHTGDKIFYILCPLRHSPPTGHVIHAERYNDSICTLTCHLWD